MRLTDQLARADSASRAVAVSRLQRGHGNAAVSTLLRGHGSRTGAPVATIQRQPPTGAVAEVTVRELSSAELIDFVRRFPDRVHYIGESNQLFDYAWEKGGGGKGKVAAFQYVGEEAPTSIRVNGSRLSEEVRNEVVQTLRTHHGAKEAARAERLAAKAAERRAAGMAETAAPRAETPAAPSAVEGPTGGAEAKAGSAEAKLGKAETAVAGAEARALEGGAETLAAESRAVGAAARGSKGGAEAVRLAGYSTRGLRVAQVARLVADLGLAGLPFELFFMFVAAFGSIAEAKAKLRADAFALGFGRGIAASLLNESPRDAMYSVVTPSMGERVAGFEGVRERGTNEGVAAGYKFGQALNTTQRQGFLQKLREELKARNTLKFLTGDFKRDSSDMGVALRPTVLKLLEEAARQEEERRLREEMIRMSRRRPGEV